MKGLKALDKIQEYCEKASNNVCDLKGTIRNAVYISTIERELKVLQILKEKRVNLALLSMVVSHQEYKTAKRIANVYNIERRSDWAKALTEEDVTLIVKWLKEE